MTLCITSNVKRIPYSRLHTFIMFKMVYLCMVDFRVCNLETVCIAYTVMYYFDFQIQNANLNTKTEAKFILVDTDCQRNFLHSNFVFIPWDV